MIELFWMIGFMFFVLVIGILHGLYEQSKADRVERALRGKELLDATDKRCLGDAWDQIPTKSKS
jgi:hypothetical protein